LKLHKIYEKTDLKSAAMGTFLLLDYNLLLLKSLKLVLCLIDEF